MAARSPGSKKFPRETRQATARSGVAIICYTCGMPLNLGSGPALKDFSPWLRDESERHARILEVTERDSVIEGLPPFAAETRARIMAQLKAIVGRSPAPAGSPSSSDGNPS
jgi:hypothetical protein